MYVIVQCCQDIKKQNIIPSLIDAMNRYREVLQPLLPWVTVRAEEGRVAGDLDVSLPEEPRIAHYCTQTLANLACDDKPERAADIPTFQVQRCGCEWTTSGGMCYRRLRAFFPCSCCFCRTGSMACTTTTAQAAQ